MKQPLNLANKLKRLEFARIHQTWNDQWKNVVWSDEKRWNLDGPNGNCKVWHDNRRPRQILKKRHAGGGSLMVWGTIKADGSLALIKCPITLNTSVYQVVL